MIMYRCFSLCIIILLTFTLQAQAETFDHSAWSRLLADNVHVINDGTATQVDYDGFVANRTNLQNYLKTLSAVSQNEFDSWNSNEQLAFLINAYNSWTVELILSRYPDLKSIKDLGSFFSSPWKKNFFTLFGAQHSLDYIEQDLIRGSGRYNDPRIHFAINCASIGCPALRPEAYSPADLSQQLDEATISFLQDRSRNRLEGNTLQVSSIFKWYKKDFEKGWKSISSLEQFFAYHAAALELDNDKKQSMLKGTIKITFLDYNWNLNSTP